ncbi:MAG: hypothetical protein KC442_10725 [Thermomicrobiales bacterium]|nr:hypothetical protein [Thermomicrobiales bacterium]
MDGSQFDHLARSLSLARTRRGVAALLAGAAATPLLVADARKHKKHKKKKKCARKCQDGCCTSTKGTCIRPAQQSATQCGTGGEICRTTGCVSARPNDACSASNPCPTGQCCGGSGTCGACLAFVTSTLHNGALGGLEGADAVCQDLAAGAGLPGVYMAWLSDSTGSPADRFMRATAPYTLRGGPIIANNWDDLTSGGLQRALNKTEQGTGGALSSKVWTNTASDGTARTDTRKSCSNWSSNSTGVNGYDGMLSSISATWTARDESSCDSTIRLYCFQQW